LQGVLAVILAHVCMQYTSESFLASRSRKQVRFHLAVPKITKTIIAMWRLPKFLGRTGYHRQGGQHHRCLSTSPSQQETFLTGTTSVYAEQLYEKYQQNPDSVHESWRRYFDNLGKDIPFEASAFSSPTTLVDPKSKPRTVDGPSDSLGVAHLIRAYQVNGHLAADLDPLATYSPETFPYRPQKTGTDGLPADLTVEYHGFDQNDMDRSLRLLGRSSGGNTGYLEQLSRSPHNVTLRSVLAELRKTYTGTIGVEYMVRTFCATHCDGYSGD
jgi:2-oxoglutarate dehydrogenase E1 component